MLKHKDSTAIVAVKDLQRARNFYADTLGLDLLEATDDVLQFKTGATKLVVYTSEFAGTNQANAVVWGVDDEIEAIVENLKSKGVSFEHYEGIERQGDIHVAGDFKMVWFKDPDGNILHLNNM